jgi:hypothetical protein
MRSCCSSRKSDSAAVVTSMGRFVFTLHGITTAAKGYMPGRCTSLHVSTSTLQKAPKLSTLVVLLMVSSAIMVVLLPSAVLQGPAAAAQLLFWWHVVSAAAKPYMPGCSTSLHVSTRALRKAPKLSTLVYAAIGHITRYLLICCAAAACSPSRTGCGCQALAGVQAAQAAPATQAAPCAAHQQVLARAASRHVGACGAGPAAAGGSSSSCCASLECVAADGPQQLYAQLLPVYACERPTHCSCPRCCALDSIR